MSSYYLVLTVLDRRLEEEYIGFFRRNRIERFITMLGCGTASKSILDYLGVENNEKVVIQSVVAARKVAPLFAGMVGRMGINLPGTGIAMSIPVESIAGTSSLKNLTEGQENAPAEESSMKETIYSLIIVIAEKSRSDMVMDAARAAGARGGTVVHAKGAGRESAAKFFGVSLMPEKELIYIAVRRLDKDKVMRSIMEKAGPGTEAKAVVFSLPVEDIVGLTTLMEPEEK